MFNKAASFTNTVFVAYCSHYASNKYLHMVQSEKQLYTWKPTARYDIYNSLLYNFPRQLLAHFSGPRNCSNSLTSKG